MKSLSRTALPALVTVLLLMGTVPAWAGGPGVWTNISKNGNGIYETGQLRQTDGKLRVVWINHKGTNQDAVWQSVISPTGKLLSQSQVLAPWNTVNDDPKILSDGSGYRLVFSGIRTTQISDPYHGGNMYTETSADGNAWNLVNGSMSQSGYAYSAYGVGAVNTAAGTPIAAWAEQGASLRYHVDVDSSIPAATADTTVTTPAGEAIESTALARDPSSGDVYAAWYQWDSPPSSPDGYWAKKIFPSSGASARAPGSGSAKGTVSTDQQVALAGRIGGGVYMAYCVPKTGATYDCAHIALWKVGATGALTVPGSAHALDVAISPGPKGRLWVAWHDSAGVIHAVRTNTKATKFGILRSLKPPKNTLTIFKLAIEGSRGPVDVIVNDQVSTAGYPTTFWQTQILPGLKVVAQPSKWDNARSQTVTFTVTDAGEPVSGAKITVGGKTATTNTSGVAKISFPAGFKTGTYKVVAKKAGYNVGSTKVTVT